jgi:hypothetical protein
MALLVFSNCMYPPLRNLSNIISIGDSSTGGTNNPLIPSRSWSRAPDHNKHYFKIIAGSIPDRRRLGAQIRIIFLPKHPFINDNMSLYNSY